MSIDESLIISAVKTSKNKVKTSNMMNTHIIPKHPFRAIMSGSSGSGKTNLLIQLLTNKKFYFNYFQVIFIISPSAGKLDDSYKTLEEKKGKTKVIIINDLDPSIVDEIMMMNKMMDSN